MLQIDAERTNIDGAGAAYVLPKENLVLWTGNAFREGEQKIKTGISCFFLFVFYFF